MKDPTTETTPHGRRPPLPGRSIAVASGKGGVGKTTLCANLALAAAEYGKRVLVVDFDLGLANLDVVFRLPPGRNLRDMLHGGAPLEGCLRQGPEGIRILPASSGYRDMASLPQAEVRRLLDAVSRVPEPPDVTLLDAAAGIGHAVVEAVIDADEIVLVTTPDPSAVTDTYALLKILGRAGRTEGITLAVNLAGSRDEAYHTAGKLSRAARSFLGLDLGRFAWIPRDAAVRSAGQAQRMVLREHPTAPASRNLRFLASKVLSAGPPGGGPKP